MARIPCVCTPAISYDLFIDELCTAPREHKPRSRPITMFTAEAHPCDSNGTLLRFHVWFQSISLYSSRNLVRSSYPFFSLGLLQYQSFHHFSDRLNFIDSDKIPSLNQSPCLSSRPPAPAFAHKQYTRIKMCATSNSSPFLYPVPLSSCLMCNTYGK